MIEEIKEIEEIYPNAEARSHHLTDEEKETIISCCDENKDKIFIYSRQQPMIRRLLKNPLFDCKQKTFNKAYRCYPDPVNVSGYLPRKCLTIRNKIVERDFSEQQRREIADRLTSSREHLKQ